jgi:hypothetical protein
VYAIDQSTGEPTPIQHIETQKIHPRTQMWEPISRITTSMSQTPS